MSSTSDFIDFNFDSFIKIIEIQSLSVKKVIKIPKSIYFYKVSQCKIEFIAISLISF